MLIPVIGNYKKKGGFITPERIEEDSLSVLVLRERNLFSSSLQKLKITELWHLPYLTLTLLMGAEKPGVSSDSCKLVATGVTMKHPPVRPIGILPSAQKKAPDLVINVGSVPAQLRYIGPPGEEGVGGIASLSLIGEKA